MKTKLDEPATGLQLHTIAALCQRHHISYPEEERKMTKGEAGIMIRELLKRRVPRGQSLKVTQRSRKS